MKYPKAFEKYWKRTYNPDLKATPKQIAYRAWRAGRKYEAVPYYRRDGSYK